MQVSRLIPTGDDDDSVTEYWHHSGSSPITDFIDDSHDGGIGSGAALAVDGRSIMRTSFVDLLPAAMAAEFDGCWPYALVLEGYSRTEAGRIERNGPPDLA